MQPKRKKNKKGIIETRFNCLKWTCYMWFDPSDEQGGIHAQWKPDIPKHTDFRSAKLRHEFLGKYIECRGQFVNEIALQTGKKILVFDGE